MRKYDKGIWPGLTEGCREGGLLSVWNARRMWLHCTPRTSASRRPDLSSSHRLSPESPHRLPASTQKPGDPSEAKVKPCGSPVHRLWGLSASRGHRAPAPACQAPRDLWPSPHPLALLPTQPAPALGAPSSPLDESRALLLRGPLHLLLTPSLPLVSAQSPLTENPPLPPVHRENPIPVSASPHLLGSGFFFWALLGFPGGSDGKESACNAGDWGLIPGSGRSLGEGNGTPLQYSCLENPMDGGAW